MSKTFNTIYFDIIEALQTMSEAQKPNLKEPLTVITIAHNTGYSIDTVRDILKSIEEDKYYDWDAWN